MNIAGIDTDRQVLIIAEIGNNHEGDPAVASELIGRAAEAGVQAVKFQTFRTDFFVSPHQTERYARMKRFELSQEVFTDLAAEARRAGLLFLSTPLDLPSADFLAGIVDALKIASGDNNFYPLIEKAADSRLPLIVSGGFADLEDLAFTKALIERRWRGLGHAGSLALLHCVSAYPVPVEQANLAAVATMLRRFDCTIGYSDHCLGTKAAVLAVAAGARIVEKHFTLDCNYSSFRDHQLSADPQMLRRMVEEIREAEILLGSGLKTAQPVEQDSLVATRRSIMAARDLRQNEVIGPDDIFWLRPGDGLPPGEEDQILGRRLLSDLPAGTAITREQLS